MDKIYHAGIIGFGGMGYGYHYNVVKDHGKRFKIAGIYDIDPNRGELGRKEGLTVYESAEALLQDSNIDIVIVATPNNFHLDYVIAALKAGKHVICEKPVAMDSKELAEMIACAKETGKIFTVHQNRRLDKDFLIVKDVYEKNTIGEIFSLESRVHGARGIPQGWRQYPDVGGGMMLDWGVHLIDQLMILLPEKVKSVYCHMDTLKYPVDDYFKLFMNFESGKTALVEVSTCSYIHLPRWQVSGKDGTLRIDTWELDGRIIRAKDEKIDFEEEIIYTKAGPTKTMGPRPQNTIEELPLVEPELDGTAYVHNNLVEVIEGTAKLWVEPETTMRVMKVMEAAFLSSKEDRVVELNV